MAARVSSKKHAFGYVCTHSRESAHRIWRSFASESIGKPFGSTVDCAKDPFVTEKRTRKRMDALKASMLLEVSSVTKIRAASPRRLAVHASRSDGEVGKPIERGAAS